MLHDIRQRDPDPPRRWNRREAAKEAFCLSQEARSPEVKRAFRELARWLDDDVRPAEARSFRDPFG